MRPSFHVKGGYGVKRGLVKTWDARFSDPFMFVKAFPELVELRLPHHV